MKNILLSILVALFFSCKNHEFQEIKIDGLWTVTKVKVGEQENTPIAKWMQFNADSTQTSGNGWLQHSIGTWSFNKSKNLLTVNTTNGLIDDFEPFKVDLKENKMNWSREEERQKIQVFLERIYKRPTSEANKLYGLWKFDTIIENKIENLDKLNPTKTATLFLRWDNTYVLSNYPEGKKYGMFKTHGHRLQIDMIGYSRKPEFQFYNYHLEGKNLVLKSTNSDRELKLSRIHQFLQ